MKIAFVYDRINKWGGAERVLQALHEIWPLAPIFTSVYSSDRALWAKDYEIKTSFLQNFPLAKNNHEFYSILMPMAFENLDLSGYDIIISITSEAAKGIITTPNQLHLCYCLTPTRYLWSGYEQYFNTKLKRSLSRYFLAYLRAWDKVACFRPDSYLTISKTVQSRIKNYYHQDSDLIYPPVDLKKFTINNLQFTKDKYFLVVSRLVKYKKVDLVIKAFNQLGWSLKIVGTGREERKLKKMAKKNTVFLGELTDKQLLSYYQSCQAVIFPQEEDFGLVPLEAQACGKPVIAFGKAGALETIIENKTGLFFNQQTVESLIEKLVTFKEKNFSSEDCRNQALRFSKQNFIKEFKKKVEEKWQKK